MPSILRKEQGSYTVMDSFRDKLQFVDTLLEQIPSPAMYVRDVLDLEDTEGELPESSQVPVDRWYQYTVVDYATDVATGDGKAYIVIPAGLGGYSVTQVHVKAVTAGTTGTMDIQVHNVDSAEDLLTTLLTVDSGETGSDTAAAPAVIDASKAKLSDWDTLRIDIDAVQTTPAKGLIITIGLTKE